MTDLSLDSEWLDRLQSYATLYVGYSGGLDSTVLLHALVSQSQQLPSIHAIHINHGLSPYAADWEAHASVFCHHFGIPCTTFHLTLEPGGNLEERARTARYDAFRKMLTSTDALLLAHHQDDQAETFLLNLMRGAGVDGLSGMFAIQSFGQSDLIRPLLSFSRDQLAAYAVSHGLNWIDDESNENEHFSRNFIRKRVMPLLTSKWPSATNQISRAATHCQQAKQNLQSLAEMDGAPFSDHIVISKLTQLSRARLMNVLRVWIQHNGHQCPSEINLIRLIDELVFARQDATPEVSFGQVIFRRYQDQLYCLDQALTPELTSRGMSTRSNWTTFPKPLFLSDGVGMLIAEPSVDGLSISPSSVIEVRFREGGETFLWHGQTKALKKCLQQWRVPPWNRNNIPLIFIDGKLAAVVGYAVSDDFYATQHAFTIQLVVSGHHRWVPLSF